MNPRVRSESLTVPNAALSLGLSEVSTRLETKSLNVLTPNFSLTNGPSHKDLRQTQSQFRGDSPRLCLGFTAISFSKCVQFRKLSAAFGHYE
jgi:hypothetical protein